ncbi:MAG: acetyltransferase family protein [Cyanobacteria bacterium RYN_339]|nr:acetyltransferase family protein [Cyanobacteria bacterium RYN_339]
MFEVVDVSINPVFPPLRTERLLLRRLELTDVNAFLGYRNDPEVARFQSWDGMTGDEARAFIREQHTVMPGEPGRWAQYGIELVATGGLCGDVAIGLLPDGRQAELGFTLARAFQGQGIATEAVTTLLALAFGAWGLHRVSATTDCLNPGAIALLERLGFRREAHHVENIWFKGAWGSEYVYAVLARDWVSR